jgi:hypothetical protein
LYPIYRPLCLQVDDQADKLALGAVNRPLHWFAGNYFLHHPYASYCTTRPFVSKFKIYGTICWQA